jgi:hypothetical protein
LTAERPGGNVETRPYSVAVFDGSRSSGHFRA